MREIGKGTNQLHDGGREIETESEPESDNHGVQG